MSDRHISMRGEVIDFNRLRMANAEKPALGNASMNARGDIIGQGGVVIKTQEQIDTEYEAALAAQRENSKPVDIKDLAAVNAAGTGNKPKMPPLKPVSVEDADFEPDLAPQVDRPRRKMIESD
jgi:hypothetical protein